MRQRRIRGKLWVNPVSYLDRRDAKSKASDYQGDGFRTMVLTRKTKKRTAYDVYVTRPRLSR